MAESYSETELQNQQLDPQAVINRGYNPNKRRRMIRRAVYARWYWLRDDPNRKEQEEDWDVADKEFTMYAPPRDPDDWEADLHLPDAFSAIQAQMQETIERKARPHLSGTEQSDEPVAEFRNSIMEYNMNNTGYDYQYYLAKLSAASRGTSFLMDYWRTEKRTVKDPSDLKNGELVYTEREIIDFDDDYTEWIPNEFVYIDEKARSVDEANDGFRREIINVDAFHAKYDNKPGWFDTEYVYAGGDRSTRSFFRMPQDITEQDVEVLHYYNRMTDSYWCVANNVVVYDSPLPWKHKELPFVAVYQYRVPGRFWGMGIPKITHMLSEERRSIRNLNMDRQKLQIHKMFLHNSMFDLDDEDLVTRPHGLISVDTGGQPLNNAIQAVEYGDVAPSYFKTEEILLEDLRRATGIDDRIEGVQSGGTATEAAILKESALKRVNLISITNEMDAVIRIGRLKWSNIQFFYPVPRIERITEDNQEREQKTYRKITVNGRKFDIKDENGSKVLRMEDIRGNSALTIDKTMAKYLEGDADVYVDADIFTPISKAIEQTKKTELFSLFLSNPATLAKMDLDGAMEDVATTNGIKPDTWLKNPYGSHQDAMMQADAENFVMAAGQPLAGTPGASEDHTLVHLMFTKTEEFKNLPQTTQQIIMDHILQEHDANPATGQASDLLSAHGLTPGAPQIPTPGMGSPFAVGAGQTTQPQAQTADLQPTNFANPET